MPQQIAGADPRSIREPHQRPEDRRRGKEASDRPTGGQRPPERPASAAERHQQAERSQRRTRQRREAPARGQRSSPAHGREGRRFHRGKPAREDRMRDSKSTRSCRQKRPDKEEQREPAPAPRPAQKEAAQAPQGKMPEQSQGIPASDRATPALRVDSRTPPGDTPANPAASGRPPLQGTPSPYARPLSRAFRPLRGRRPGQLPRREMQAFLPRHEGGAKQRGSRQTEAKPAARASPARTSRQRPKDRRQQIASTAQGQRQRIKSRSQQGRRLQNTSQRNAVRRDILTKKNG